MDARLLADEKLIRLVNKRLEALPESGGSLFEMWEYFKKNVKMDALKGRQKFYISRIRKKRLVGIIEDMFRLQCLCPG